ncbi:ARM repeat-containing protein [Serendipita vermifera]|nr:ARM repeat-containing protein [Serendipita vermifera]
MENITYATSGALNRSHFSLVVKQEQASSRHSANEAARETFLAVKARMSKASNPEPTTLGGLASRMGLSLPTTPVWNSRQAREDLLLLLYCRDSLLEGGSQLSFKDLRFAVPTAFSLAEAGITMEERRAGYLFCSQVLPRGHEMQLLIVNTIRKDLESTIESRNILALDAIIASPSMDVIPAIGPRLEELLNHHSPQVRRRVVHAFRLLSSLEPDILHRCLENLPMLLQDDSISVQTASLSLLESCFQNETIDLKSTLGTLFDFVRPTRFKKNTGRMNGYSFLVVRALEILERLLSNITTDLDAIGANLLKLASKAAAQSIWTVVLASMRTISRLPSEPITQRLYRELRESKTGTHPLDFLRPLLHSTDVNMNVVLLQILTLLPVEVWAGGALEVPIQPSEEEQGDTTTRAPKGWPEASPGTEINETDLFGEGVTNEAPSEKISLTKKSTMFPPLFEEKEVGAIVGYLNSSDAALRKLSIQVLGRADPSSEGLIHQYLQQVITAATQSNTHSGDAHREQRKRLICQALDVVEYLIGDNGTIYADKVVDLLEKTDRDNMKNSKLQSPTPSQRTNVSSSTRRNARSPGGVIEGAMDAILSRARRKFLQSFSERLLTLWISQQGVSESATLLVITAAVACESSGMQSETRQNILESFSSYLTITSPSIQETLLVSMLPLVAKEGVDLDPIKKSVVELQVQSNRHIHNRCQQFLEVVSNLQALRQVISALPSINIASILSILEKRNITTVEETQAGSPPSSNKSKDAFANSQSNKRPVEKELRYTAYTSPSPPSTSSKQRSPRVTASGLLKETLNHVHARRSSGPELIELANRPDKGSHQANYRVKKLSKDIDTQLGLFQNTEEVESPFESNVSTSLTELEVPPFLSRTRSPPMSPISSPRRVPQSPPLSPSRRHTPLRGSPSSRNSPLYSATDRQAMEINFDITWDRIGAQVGSTTRGWADGEVKALVHKLRKIEGWSAATWQQDGAETRIEFKQGSQVGLMKLRQEEDGSTLWLLRCSNPSLRTLVKQLL